MLLPPVTAGFRQLARLREARAFHPSGRVGRGRLVLERAETALARALGTGEHPVTVRLSRGIGLPADRPDLLGIAIRIERAPNTDEAVDLLFTTTSQSGWARWLVLPAQRWTSRPYSTVLPYTTGETTTLLVLMPVTDWIADASPASLSEVSAARPLTFDVLESHGRWHNVGQLIIEEVGDDERIAFDPILHAAPGLRPVRQLTALREAAYRGSRRGRGD